MKLNEYQDKAMTTNKESSNNFTYSLLGLNAEIGEINDKIAKWRRNGIADIDNNRLIFNTLNDVEINFYRGELAKELGDALWFLAHLSRQIGYSFNDIAKLNLDKLRDRAMRNVIIGEGDNR
jgi:NTP pyrophosphatase (non-canonical NTP hydrolase)